MKEVYKGVADCPVTRTAQHIVESEITGEVTSGSLFVQYRCTLCGKSLPEVIEPAVVTVKPLNPESSYREHKMLLTPHPLSQWTLDGDKHVWICGCGGPMPNPSDLHCPTCARPRPNPADFFVSKKLVL